MGFLEQWWEDKLRGKRLARELAWEAAYPAPPHWTTGTPVSMVVGARAGSYRPATPKELAELGVWAYRRMRARLDTWGLNMETLKRFQSYDIMSKERHDLTRGAVL
jgi:hypothetical protein